MGFRIYEVPIRYAGRGYDAGKKITWKDGVSALHHIVRRRPCLLALEAKPREPVEDGPDAPAPIDIVRD